MAEKKPATEVAPAQTTALVDLQKELAALAVQTTETEKPSGNWISFKSGVMAVGGNPVKGNKLSVVVIGSVFENQLYEGKYDPNNPQTPVCYAIAENDDDLKPHPEALKPQASSCAECPMNAWKSDPDGGRGKACKNVRRLALIGASDLEDVPKSEVALAKLPVTSVKNWSTYANQVANVLKIPPLAVITEMSVEPNAKTQFQVNFQLVDRIENPEAIRAILAKRAEVVPLLFQGYDKPIDPPAKAAAEGSKKY